MPEEAMVAIYGDHPRIRGEHWPKGTSQATPYGIIPAYAGSTDSVRLVVGGYDGSSPHTRGALSDRALMSTVASDHPRIRGEHGNQRDVGGLPSRIIPAYAGSTQTPSSA